MQLSHTSTFILSSVMVVLLPEPWNVSLLSYIPAELCTMQRCAKWQNQYFGHPFLHVFLYVVNSASFQALTITAHGLCDIMFLQCNTDTKITSLLHRDAGSLSCEWFLVCVLCDTVTADPRAVSILASCAEHGPVSVQVQWQYRCQENS